MTQNARWLAALALLLAFGAYAVRAEEEETPPPPKPTVVELLPAPHAVPVDTPVVPIAWLFQFPAPPSCPTPFPLFGVAGCSQACPACPACTCRQDAMIDAPQYVVELKMMKAGEDGMITCPRLTVFEGQNATVQLHGVETPREQSTLQMQVTMRKQGKGALLDLTVLDAMTCNDGESGVRTHTETTESQCNIPFGKPHKMVLKHDADGMETSWMEVTVREIEQAPPAQHTASVQVVPAPLPVAMKESDESAVVIIADVVEQVFDSIADAASEWFAPESPAQPQDLRSATYLENPPQYTAQPQPLPLPREMASREGTCPNAGRTCIQCVAAEVVQKPAMHITIDATHERKCVEMSDGKKHFKATADRLTVHDDCIQLEGDVRGESCDDACHDCMTIKADKILVQRKDEGLKIHIND